MAVTPVVQAERREETLVPVRIVDCDVHPLPVTMSEISKFVPERWRYSFKEGPIVPFRVDVTNNGARGDARPADGAPVGSDPDLLERQLLGEAGVDIAIMIMHSLGIVAHPEADAARVSALNEWQAATWVGEYNHHGRYRASIRLSPINVEASLREIERWGEHPGFVQVLAGGGYMPAFGHPQYDPVWRACAERGLPVAVHATNNALGGVQYTHPFGPPTYNFELHAISYPIKYAAHIASLICSGTFERIPELKFVFIEGGIGWAAALGQHLDRNWQLLKQEVPHLKLAPSEYLRRNVYFSTQPIEEPDNPEALVQIYQLLGEDTILFSTDYPHWDFDDPKLALPRKMPAELRSKVMAGNALALYNLPHERPA